MQRCRYVSNSASFVSFFFPLFVDIHSTFVVSYRIVTQSLYVLHHRGAGKLVCWRLDERGSVGETPLHVCLLKATFIHANLAKRMVQKYPELVHDFYINDEFYGNKNLFCNVINI